MKYRVPKHNSSSFESKLRSASYLCINMKLACHVAFCGLQRIFIIVMYENITKCFNLTRGKSICPFNVNMYGPPNDASKVMHGP